MNIIRDLTLENGTAVDIEKVDKQIVIKLRQNLDDVLSSITDENFHHVIDFGIPEGREVW
jgi:antitoxin component of MazEF toxin-antitoxin module